MDQNERKKLEEGLELFLDEGLERLLLSHPTEPSGCSRSRIRPLLLKGELVFQAEEQIGKQAFHRNLTKEEAVAYVCQMLNKNFRQNRSGFGKQKGKNNRKNPKEGTDRGCRFRKNPSAL